MTPGQAGTGSTTAYLAPVGYVEQLEHELGTGVITKYDRLLVVDGPPRPVAWVANVWRDPVTIAIDSIGHGAKALHAIQRNWSLYSFCCHRRAALLQSKLPHVSAHPLRFPEPAPAAALGSWTLLDEGTILAAAHCSSPFPNGEARFVEDRVTPPNRAYLKLWEVLTLLGTRPVAGQVCLDLGSSPGGWTWVLQETGARVISVDKAKLAPAIAALPRVQFRQESAFAVEPHGLGEVDWLFCDVACYPRRLLALVRKWVAAGTCRRFVCTIKFQAETDHEATAEFAAIPGSRLLHLAHNKHELTWVLLPQ